MNFAVHYLKQLDEREKENDKKEERNSEKLNNELCLMEQIGFCQKWTLKLGDGKTSKFLITSWDFIATIRMWPGGGLSGVLHEAQGPKRLCKKGGEIFGSWNLQGVSFHFLLRDGCDGFAQKLFSCHGQFKTPKIIEGTAKNRSTETEITMNLISDFEQSESKECENIFWRRFRERFKSEEQQFFDFKIICNDQTEIKCHKIIVASQTKYFDGLFRQQSCDSSQIDFSGDIVKACIDYLYTEDIIITGENVQDLIVAANFLIIPEVVDKCICFIFDNMNTTDCIDVLNFGSSYNFEGISKKAIDVISFNFSFVLDEIGNLEKLGEISFDLFKSIINNKHLTLRNRYKIILSHLEKKEKLNHPTPRRHRNRSCSKSVHFTRDLNSTIAKSLTLVI